jgi:hypothetical protein
MMDLRDQDDLEMLIELSKEDAKLNRREFGRAEVCIFPRRDFPVPWFAQQMLMEFRLLVLHECSGFCDRAFRMCWSYGFIKVHLRSVADIYLHMFLIFV